MGETERYSHNTRILVTVRAFVSSALMSVILMQAQLQERAAEVQHYQSQAQQHQSQAQQHQSQAQQYQNQAQQCRSQLQQCQSNIQRIEVGHPVVGYFMGCQFFFFFSPTSHKIFHPRILCVLLTMPSIHMVLYHKPSLVERPK